MENNKQHFESLLNEVFLAQDFDAKNNEGLLGAVSESVFSKNIRPSISNSYLKLLMKWASLVLISSALILSSIYFSTFNVEAKYFPKEIMFEDNDFQIEKIDKITKAGSKEIQALFLQPSPKEAKFMALPIVSTESDSIKVYRPETQFKEIQSLTNEEIEKNNKEKEKLIKDVLKVNKTKLSEVKVFAQFIHEGEKELSDFIIWNTEISNKEYRIFLFDLLIQGRKSDYQLAKVYDKGWTELYETAFLEPMESKYSWHPAYYEYPVVNISREGANLFCKWLTVEIQKRSKNKYDLLEVKIPTNRQWEYAASSGGKFKPYPWGGPYIRNSKGCYLTNHKPGEGHFNDDGGLTTVKVDSYAPNEIGLFNISGNVAEMVYYPYQNNQVGARGGSWVSDSEQVKIYGDDPHFGDLKPSPIIGFRPIITYRTPRTNGRLHFDNPTLKAELTQTEKEENAKRKYNMIKSILKADKDAFADRMSGFVKNDGKNELAFSFAIQKTEVSNIEYKTFLFDLIVQKRFDEFDKVKPNSKLWLTDQGFYKPFVDNYFSHPAYDNYPVVNISREGAELYANWLFEELKKIDIRKKRKDIIQIRLPNYMEWMFAAKDYGYHKIYPWEGNKIQSTSGKSKGKFRANFKVDKKVKLGKAGNLNDNADITAPVKSYWPNGRAGLYNIVGNVSEMIQYPDGEYGCLGGSWKSSADQLKFSAPDTTKGNLQAGPTIGFRIILDYKDPEGVGEKALNETKIEEERK